MEGDEVLPQAAAMLCAFRRDVVHDLTQPRRQPFWMGTVRQQQVLLFAGVDSEQREQGNFGHEGWWRWLQRVPPDEMRSGRQWQLGPLADVAQQGADAVHFEHKNV